MEKTKAFQPAVVCPITARSFQKVERAYHIGFDEVTLDWTSRRGDPGSGGGGAERDGGKKAENREIS